jgi:hypothetical protein
MRAATGSRKHASRLLQAFAHSDAASKLLSFCMHTGAKRWLLQKTCYCGAHGPKPAAAFLRAGSWRLFKHGLPEHCLHVLQVLLHGGTQLQAA